MIENQLYITISSIILVGFIYKLCDYFLRLPRLPNDANRYIFITGCDTGFGNLLAKRLDSKGCHVIAGCLTEKGETELRKKSSDRLKTVSLDVSKHDSVITACEFVKATLPSGRGLWGLVNNAGIMGKFGPPEWMRREDYIEVMNVNFLGVTDVCSTFMPLVRKEKGRIVNMTSSTGRVGLCTGSAYCSSKASLILYSDCLRRHLRGSGVSVHIMEPGVANTPITATDHVLACFRRTFDEAEDRIKTANKEEYQGYLEEIRKRSENKAAAAMILANPERVVDAYEHALFARYPRACYVVGLHAKILLVLQALPTGLGDYLMNLLNGRVYQPNEF